MSITKSTIVVYEYSGSTNELTIPFDYLKRDFVVVALGGDGKPQKALRLGTDYRFATKTTIVITRQYQPDEGYNKVIVRRVTDASKRIINYQDGSILNASELNTSQLQALHVAEEARDLANYTLFVDDNNNLDARGRKIINLGDPTNAQDAVTKKYIDNASEGVIDSRNKALQYRNEAEVFRNEAEAFKNQAESHKDRAVTAETNAKDSETKAEAYKEQVSTQIAKAVQMASQAQNSASEAKLSQKAAKISEQNAAESAASAKADAATVNPANIVHRDTLQQTLGVSTTEVMSQRAVTEAFGAKADNIEALKSLDLQQGIVVDVYGYYDKYDGASHKRYISGIKDESSVELNNGLYANIKARGIVQSDWFGAKGDGVSDDWEALQKAIIFSRKNAKTLIIVGGVYLISKTLYVTASSIERARSSVNGENLQDGHEHDSLKIIGSGILDTIIKYEGPNHAFQVGEFGDSSYGLATKATWYGTIQDLAIEANKASRGLCLVWCHYYQLERVKVSGGTHSTVQFFDGKSSLCLWNKVESCHFSGYESKYNFIMHGNSNLCIDTFAAGGSSAVLVVSGERNSVHRFSAENTKQSGKTPYFVECLGGCSFYDVEFETGAGGVNGGFYFKTESQCLVQNPIFVGITGPRFTVDPTVKRPRIMLIGAETQHNLSGNEQTIRALGNSKDAKIILDKVCIKPRMLKVVKTLQVGKSPSWSSFQNLVSGSTYNGYGSGLLFNGVSFANNTTGGTVYIQLRGYRGNDTYLDLPSKTIAGSSDTVIYDQKDYNFAMFSEASYDYFRNFHARCKSSNEGTVDVTLYYTEV